jgi:hypothetical protein
MLQSFAHKERQTSKESATQYEWSFIFGRVSQGKTESGGLMLIHSIGIVQITMFKVVQMTCIYCRKVKETPVEFASHRYPLATFMHRDFWTVENRWFIHVIPCKQNIRRMLIFRECEFLSPKLSNFSIGKIKPRRRTRPTPTCSKRKKERTKERKNKRENERDETE